jgi:hypothetical protein
MPVDWGASHALLGILSGAALLPTISLRLLHVKHTIHVPSRLSCSIGRSSKRMLDVPSCHHACCPSRNLRKPQRAWRSSADTNFRRLVQLKLRAQNPAWSPHLHSNLPVLYAEAPLGGTAQALSCRLRQASSGCYRSHQIYSALEKPSAAVKGQPNLQLD